MQFPFFSRRPEPPADAPAQPSTIETLIATIAGYISPGARQERARKAEGNPAERQIERETISRTEAHFRAGFPVAGHGEPEPVNNPKLRQRSKLVP